MEGKEEQIEVRRREERNQGKVSDVERMERNIWLKESGTESSTLQDNLWTR